jgi:hypothetical protein
MRPKKLASTSSEKAVIAVAPVCADKFGALPDVAARTAIIVADGDNSYKMHGAFPEALITLPGKTYPDSDLTEACAGLILAPPKTAASSSSRRGVFEITNKPAVPTDADKKADVTHPGMMGDGTEEQNLNQRGDPAARIKKNEVDAAFGKQSPEK